MNNKLFLALAIAFTGQVLYHFCQKSVAPGAHPIVALIAFYAVAALASVPLFIAFPFNGNLGQQMSGMNWAVIGVGISIVLIEVGFLLAYRVGGELSTAFVFTSAAAATALFILGVVVHGESLSASRLAGVAFALLGIALVSRG